MLKGRFLYDDLLKAVGPTPFGTYPDVTHTGAASGIADSNLWDANRWCFWESDGDASVEIVFDLGTDWQDYGEAVAWGLVQHNAYTIGCSAALLLVGNPDDGSTWNITAGAIVPTGHPEYEPHVGEVFVTGYSKRYWKAWFFGCGAALRLGRIYIARSVLEFDQTPDLPFARELEDQTAWAKTEAGQSSHARRGEVLEDVDLLWVNMGTTSADELADLWYTQRGGRHPLLYCQHDPSASDPAPARYGYAQNLAMTERSPGSRHQARLTFQEKR